jgi:hypothetical protein
MAYSCPLCGRPVSASLYHRITGIWKERQKLLKRMRNREAKRSAQLRTQRDRLHKEMVAFERQKADIVRQAVDRRTTRLGSQIRHLRTKEVQARRATRERIRRAVALADKKAKRGADTRFRSLKRQFRSSIRDQMRKERELGSQQTQRKYERLRRTFHSTLVQMKGKNTQLQQQAGQIRELERQLQRETTPQIEGLLYESNLIRELKQRFPEDRFQHTGKGGDVIQEVMRKGERAGTIVYECKRVKHYSASHVRQAADAKKKRKADFAILVTNAMKKGVYGFFIERGVIGIHATGVVSLAGVLRNQLIQISEMKLGQSQRDRAVKLTLEYLEGPEFANSMEMIIQESTTLYNNLMDEVRKHIATWRKRYDSYRKVYEEAFTVRSTAKAMLRGQPEPKKLLRKGTLPALVQLPNVE